jgi:haloalkane dehalogenase
MQRNYRNLEAVFVGQGSHYIQEDVPEAIGRNVAAWILRLEEPGLVD